MVQDAYLRAYKGLKRFRGDAEFTTWMYRITANSANTLMGKRTKHRHDELPETLEDGDHAGDPVAQADAMALRADLADALGDLSPKLRAVVVLRDVYELPHEDIAAELGISETACKVRLHRARLQLKERLFPRRATRSTVRVDIACDDVAEQLSASAATPATCSARRPRHVESCLRCQADLVQYRKLLRSLRSLRTEVLEPAPGLLPEILAGLEQAGERHAIRAVLNGRRAAYLGGIAAATAAGAAGRHRARQPHRSASSSPADETRQWGSAGASASVVASRPPRAVAQLAEHRSPKPAVGGSIPSCPAHPDVSEVATSMAMNREQKRLLKKQGQLNEAGEPVRGPRPKRAAAPRPRHRAVQFAREVRGELRKVAWPSRDEVANYSVVVLVGIVVLTAMIAGLDYVLGEAVLKLFER